MNNILKSLLKPIKQTIGKIASKLVKWAGEEKVVEKVKKPKEVDHEAAIRRIRKALLRGSIGRGDYSHDRFLSGFFRACDLADIDINREWDKLCKEKEVDIKLSETEIKQWVETNYIDSNNYHELFYDVTNNGEESFNKSAFREKVKRILRDILEDKTNTDNSINNFNKVKEKVKVMMEVVGE